MDTGSGVLGAHSPLGDTASHKHDEGKVGEPWQQPVSQGGPRGGRGGAP